VCLYAATSSNHLSESDLSNAVAGNNSFESQPVDFRVRSSWILLHEHRLLLHDQWMAREGLIRELEKTIASETPFSLLQQAQGEQRQQFKQYGAEQYQLCRSNADSFSSACYYPDRREFPTILARV